MSGPFNGAILMMSARVIRRWSAIVTNTESARLPFTSTTCRLVRKKPDAVMAKPDPS